MFKSIPCRLHLLPAKAAPMAVVVRRKPSKVFHIIAWDTSTDVLTSGSWFRGKLHPLRGDVSFDGAWMVYLAMGSNGETWNGLCRLPWLKSSLDADNMGTWFGGGYWSSPDVLRLNGWAPSMDRRSDAPPFRLETYHGEYGEDEGVLFPRLDRDGWRREGPFGREEVVGGSRRYMVRRHDDPGWSWRFSSEHPNLRMFSLGYLELGRAYRFALDEFPALLDDRVSWATWDALGQLLAARAGSIERYTLDDLKRGRPGFVADLSDLAPPPRLTSPG